MKRLALSLALMPLLACAPTIRVQRMKPAEANIKGHTRVAFVPFRGNDGDQLSSDLQRIVSQANFFELVDREMMGQIIQEHKLTLDGLMENDGSIKLGGMLSAGALIVGDATARYDEQITRERSTCAKYEKGKRMEYPCTEVSRVGMAYYDANLKVVDTSTSRTLALRPYHVKEGARVTAKDATPGPIDRERLVSNLRSSVAREFSNVIMPHAVQEDVELVKDGDLPQLAEGNRFAKINNFEAAAQRYMEAVTLASGNALALSGEQKAKAFYSLGVALVLQGDYPNGLGYLKTAANLDPDEAYARMLARAQTWQREAEKVSSQTAGTGEGQ